MNAISSTPESGLYYNFTTHELSIYDGTAWRAMFDAGNLTGTLPSGSVPAPTASTLGGVFSKSVVSHQFLTGVGTGTGSPSSAQPAFSDLSGAATAAQIPNPSSSSIGGVQSAASVTHQWINSISTSGVPALSQPAFSDVSGSVAASQMPALTGDVTSSAGAVATTVVKIQGVAVATTSPTAGQVLTYNSATSRWDPETGLNGVLTVSSGGTGNSSLTNHGMLVGAGTTSITVIPPDASTTKVWTSGGASADPSWQSPTGGVTGPVSSTDTAIALWNGTAGTAVKNSSVLVDSSGDIDTTGDTIYVKLHSTTDTTATGSFALDHNSTSAILQTAESSTNAGYTLKLQTANIAGSNANKTGEIQITTGNKTAGTGNSGDVTVTTGTSAGGTRGRINHVDGTDGFAGLVWTSMNNSGGGHWMKPTADINFIANPDAELNTTAWATYADAAGALPVDGTGGSPTVTWTRTTSSPLSGAGSFLFTKDAANRQGNGASYDFSIRTADKAKVMQIEFDYVVASGTFVAGSNGVDSDIEVYIYDVTNAVVIQPTTYKLFASTTSPPSHFTANFQTASNSTSYRLILHTATTSASAYTVQFDSVTVAPSRYTYGTPVTDWVAYTPTFTGYGSPTAITFYSRRVGDSLEVRGTFTSGISTAVPNKISIGYNGVSGNVVVDTTKSGTSQLVGMAGGSPSSTTLFGFGVLSPASNDSTVSMSVQTSAISITAPQNASVVASTGQGFQLNFRVPIVGWSSTIQMSDSAPQTLISMSGLIQTPTGTLTSSFNVIKFGTVTTDSSGAYATGTGLYTCPTQGRYRVYGNVEILGTYTAGQSSLIKIFKNGTGGTSVSLNGFSAFSSVTTTQSIPFQGAIDCNAGDTLGVYSNSSGSTLSYTATLTGSSLFIEKLSDPRTVGAMETVAFSGLSTLTTSLTTNTFVTVTYATVIKDSHSAMSSGTFTAPAAGLYQACGAVTVVPSVAGELVDNFITVGSSSFATRGSNVGAGASVSVPNCLTAPMVSGQTASMQVRCTFGSGTCALNTGLNNSATFSITKVGNY